MECDRPHKPCTWIKVFELYIFYVINMKQIPCMQQFSSKRDSILIMQC